jgi:glycosyltransferase involved in cell wall biosynthesis
MSTEPRRNVDVSVIIPSYESQATARATLESLRRQSFQDFETILVDSGRSDGVAKIASDFPEVRYQRSKQQLLPHAARNVGIKMARGDLLVFTDPDIVAAPDWLEKLVAAYGRSATPLAGAVASLQKGWLGTGVHLAKFDLWLPGGKRATVPVAASVNFLCTRQLLKQVGGFDGREMIGDTIMSWDLTGLGQTPRFVPDAIVYHDHRSSFVGLLRERFVRGGDFGRLRAEREDWNFGRTLAIMLASIVPLRLLKLVARTFWSAWESGCVFDWLRTIPVITAGHAAWLAGESGQYWRRLQWGRARYEAKRACG